VTKNNLFVELLTASGKVYMKSGSLTVEAAQPRLVSSFSINQLNKKVGEDSSVLVTVTPGVPFLSAGSYIEFVTGPGFSLLSSTSLSGYTITGTPTPTSVKFLFGSSFLETSNSIILQGVRNNVARSNPRPRRRTPPSSFASSTPTTS
jgi:hypothetical protein